MRDAAPLTVVPQCAGAAFNPRQVVVDWHEAIQRLDFRVRRVAGASEPLSGHIHIFVGPVLVADVPVAFAVDAGVPAGAPAPAPVPASVDGYTRIYLCHAPGEPAVARAIDAAVPFLNMPFIGECAALREMAAWDRTRFRKIEAAEAFVLYWSEAAAASPDLRKEWEFAAALERADFVHTIVGRAQAAELPPDMAPGDGVHCVNW